MDDIIKKIKTNKDFKDGLLSGLVLGFLLMIIALYIKFKREGR